MTKKTETAVATKPESAVATATMADFGGGNLTAKDVIIPKILAMQGLSDLVTDGKAKMGDFVDSMSNEVIGDIENPIEFIPFHMEKIYIITKRKEGDSGRFEFDRIEEVTNQDYPFTNFMEGMEFKYEYCLQFYCLRPEDTSLPYVISFKSTSLKTGKILSTQMFVRNKAAGLVPPAYVMALSGRKEKNDKGTFIVMEVKPKGKTSDDLINQCLTWYKTVASGKAKADTSDIASTGNGSPAPSNF